MIFKVFFLFGDLLELENRLLARFDVATQKRDLSTMGEYGKILSQVIQAVSVDLSKVLHVKTL